MNVKTQDLIEALKNSNGEIEYYLSLTTGKIIFLSEYEKEQEGFDEEEFFDESEYIYIEPIHSSEKFPCLELFSSQVKNNKISLQLSKVLTGPKPFKNFKIIIESLGEERDQWFEFENKFMTEFATNWLEENAQNFILN